jgi:hypothetical protein
MKVASIALAVSVLIGCSVALAQGRAKAKNQ